MHRKFLIIDDDEIFCHALARAVTKKEMNVQVATNFKQAMTIANDFAPDYVTVDLNMPDGSGLELSKALLAFNPNLKIVMLTGYSSIATAVEAIKLGVVHYLVKPASVDEIIAAFMGEDTNVTINVNPLSPERLEWEHIQKILALNAGNISKTALQLSMHRRTLQRKLAKKPVLN